MDTKKTDLYVEPEKVSHGYEFPIAKSGEQQFACILRNRSGQSAGEIDMAARSLEGLGRADQQEAVNCVFAVYEKWCSETGLKAVRDK